MLNITIGQTYIYLCVLFLIAGIIYSAFAMFLSQVLNNRSAATAIMVIGLFLSMINVPESIWIAFQKYGAISLEHILVHGHLQSTG